MIEALDGIIPNLLRALIGTPLGWGLLMPGRLLFSGTKRLMLGMAGENIGRLYLTVNKRPKLVVREVVRNSNRMKVD